MNGPDTDAAREKAFQAVHTALLAAAAALAAALFHFRGVTDVGHHPLEATTSLFVWLRSRWGSLTQWSDLSHGWVIPFVSAWLVWRRRKECALRAGRSNPWGLAVVLLALALHWAGTRSQQPRLSFFSLLGLLWGVPFFVYGWAMARVLAFPLLYLVFCLPWYFLAELSLPLRLLAAGTANLLLNGLGIPMIRTGTGLTAADSGFRIDVAEPCSGLSSLLAIMALAAAYAAVTPGGFWRRLAIFLSSIPLAIVGNVARIMTIAVIGHWFGAGAATDFYHRYSGYIVFAVAVVLMLAVAHWIQRRPASAAAAAGPPAAPPAPASGARSLSLAALAPPAVVVALLSGVLAALGHMPPLRVVPLTSVRMALPETVGAWTGYAVRYCQNAQCLAMVSGLDLPADATACPKCGALLDATALSEKRLLPADTRLVKKLYVRGPRSMLVSLVIAGQQRSSIHRPEVCMVAQGHRLERSVRLAVPLAEGPVLRLKVLDLRRDPAPGAPAYPAQRSVFAYWFVGPGGGATPSNLERMLREAWDRVALGRLSPWCYYALAGARTGDADGDRRVLEEFVAEFYPLTRPGEPRRPAPAQ